MFPDVALLLYVCAVGENRFAIALREWRATVIPNRSFIGRTKLIDGLQPIRKAKTHLTYIARFFFVRTRLAAGAFFYCLSKAYKRDLPERRAEKTPHEFLIFILLLFPLI